MGCWGRGCSLWGVSIVAEPGDGGASVGSADLDRRIGALIEGAARRDGWRGGGVDDGEFAALALELFAYQYERNAPYRRFCRARGVEPGHIADWTQVPPVPLSAFREVPLVCEPPEAAAAVFMTSGSTDPARRGRNHHPHLRLYDASLRASFAHLFVPDRERLRLLVVNPRPEVAPHSSLAYFLGRLVDFFGAPGSDFFFDGEVLQGQRLVQVLGEVERSGEPVGLLGTSFAYVHLLDVFAEEGLSFQLPVGSRLLDTGGYKGRSREVPAAELRALFGQRLGLPDAACVNYYGMTEISTQYYDTTVRSQWRGDAEPPGPRRKAVPPWARVRVVDPETMRSVAVGERGLLVHYDLANRGSCQAVLSEDVGYLTPEASASTPGGFVLLGRAEGTEARGCSVATEDMLTAHPGLPR